jgi:hypothetical protein
MVAAGAFCHAGFSDEAGLVAPARRALLNAMVTT